MPKKVFAIAFPVVAIAFLAWATLGGSANTQTERRVIRQLPATWVAFSADFLQNAPKYPRPDKGRFYRNLDGSERNEIYDGLTIGVMIKNIPERTFYRRIGGPDARWQANPMVLPPEGWHPETELVDSPNISLWNELFEGMEAYRFKSLKGDVETINVPDLNFFKVIATLPGGKWVRFSNIKFGEPDPALFNPPPGAEIRHSSTPDGIVFSTQG